MWSDNDSFSFGELLGQLSSGELLVSRAIGQYVSGAVRNRTFIAVQGMLTVMVS